MRKLKMTSCTSRNSAIWYMHKLTDFKDEVILRCRKLKGRSIGDSNKKSEFTPNRYHLGTRAWLSPFNRYIESTFFRRVFLFTLPVPYTGTIRKAEGGEEAN